MLFLVNAWAARSTSNEEINKAPPPIIYHLFVHFFKISAAKENIVFEISKCS